MADTIRVSARELREAAARAGGFDHLTINDVQAVVNRKADAEAGEPPKRSKYRNVRTRVGDEVFDSKREAQHWHELKLREQAGEISELRRQVSFSLFTPTNVLPAVATSGLEALQCHESGIVQEVARYVADFTFRDSFGVAHVQDVKGGRATQTQLYKLKKKWLELQSGIVVEEV